VISIVLMDLPDSPFQIRMSRGQYNT